jgi:hypothetical protein
MTSAEITKNIIISEIEESLLGNKSNASLRSKLNQVYSFASAELNSFDYLRESIREELNSMKEI